VSRTSKRTPYLEVAVTVAVLAFLAFVVAGVFNQRTDEPGQVTMSAN
jgi:hypothetical protein